MLGRLHIALCASLALLAVVVCCVLMATSDPGGGRAPTVNPQAALEPDSVPFTDPPFDEVVFGGDDALADPFALPSTQVPPGEVTSKSVVPDAVQTAPAATGPVRGDSGTVQPGTAQSRGEAALASLPFPWQELGVTVSFRDHAGGTLGLVYPRSKRVVIYVKRTQSEQGLRVTIAHELGHALDNAVNTTASRKAYLAARGVSTRTPWLPCLSCSDYASGAGDFAEVFALATAGFGDFRSQLAPAPTYAQLAALRPFFLSPSQRAPVAQAAPAAPAAPAPRPVTTVAPPTRAPVKPAPAPTKTACGLVDSLLSGGC